MNTQTNTLINLHEDPMFRFFYNPANKWGDFDHWCERNGFKLSYHDNTSTSSSTNTNTSSSTSTTKYNPAYRPQQAHRPPQKHHNSHRPPPAKKSKLSTSNLFSLLEED